MEPLYIILIIVAVLAVVVIGLYNNFVKKVNRTDEAWSDIEVQLKRRYNLIPNLVKTVQGYATHEKEVFENVTKARAAALGATGAGAAGAAEGMLASALKSVFAIAEAYPDLKANENFLELQRELSDTENKIQASRRFYNGNVRDLNTAVQTFPGNMIASMFKFAKREFFNLDGEDEARKVPEVAL